MKAGTIEHVKFKRLKRALNLPDWQAVGVLESVWHFCARSHMDGSIGKSSNIDIAISIGWERDEDELVDSLVEAGWLDVCEEHRLVVHDWEHHCPTYIKGNLAKHGKRFAKQGAKHVAQHVAKQGASDAAKQGAKHVAQHGATYPSLAYPIQSNPSSADLPPPDGDGTCLDSDQAKADSKAAEGAGFRGTGDAAAGTLDACLGGPQKLPAERGYDPMKSRTWPEIERIGPASVRTDQEAALALSAWQIARTGKARGRKMVAKPDAAPIIKLFKNGVTPRQVADAVVWLNGANLSAEYPFEVLSSKSLYDKWDRIQSAMHKDGRKKQTVKTMTEEDVHG